MQAMQPKEYRSSLRSCLKKSRPDAVARAATIMLQVAIIVVLRLNILGEITEVIDLKKGKIPIEVGLSEE